jgi:hypothetical protein
VGADEVRRLLGHEAVSTTLRYSSLWIRFDVREKDDTGHGQNSVS